MNQIHALIEKAHKGFRLGRLVFLAFVLVFSATGQGAVRREIKIPNIPGYVVVKCDFHNHTVFSDGEVWPTVRAEEAWREGLDAFAITDHLEYSPHEQDIRINPNRPYEIAKPKADALGLTIIRGAEITRDMPPGHFNAIFLKDANALAVNDWKDAIKAAVDQDAFVFWNHPGWVGQQPDGKSIWYEEHTQLYEKGWIKGIEIVNERDYYPAVHKWCLEKKLTMLGNSDVHGPTGLDYDLCGGEHRAMTFVLAKDKSQDAIKEALLARRTVVYWKNNLIGQEEYLRPIFDASVEIINSDVTIKGKERTLVQIRNKAGIDFELVADGGVDEIRAPAEITLYGDRTVLFGISAKSKELSGIKKISIPYTVKNLWTAPEQSLSVHLAVSANFVPSAKN
jgi:hypothetical protein